MFDVIGALLLAPPVGFGIARSMLPVIRSA
jgi:hypothetical protein